MKNENFRSFFEVALSTPGTPGMPETPAKNSKQ